MAYRYDPNLEFLRECSDDDLNQLVYLLTHDKDGSTRLTETLTLSDKYKVYYPRHSLYWEQIAEEIQCFGGNTFSNLIRAGKGVLYKEVLMDVCDKLKANYNKDSAIERIEEALLMKILTDAIERMGDDERQNFAREVGIKNTSNITTQALLASFQKIFAMGGFKSYQLTLIIVNAVLKALIGRGISIAGNAALTRTMAILTGPIGWAITALWTAADIAGPAYRVTIPAVIEIAYLRKKQQESGIVDEISFG